MITLGATEDLVEKGATAGCAATLVAAGVDPKTAASSCAAGVGWLFSRGCTPKGGTLWVLEECVGFPNMATGYCQPENRRAITPVPLAAREGTYERSLCIQAPATGPQCAVTTYCQLPGMPAPVRRPLLARDLVYGARGATAAVTHYPEGTIATWDAPRRVFRIAVPVGLGGGAATHTEVDAAADKPAEAHLIALTDFEKAIGAVPWYRNWRVWAVAGGVAAAGGLGVWLLRRRQRRQRR